MTIHYKKNLSESDISAKHITPALVQAGWDEDTQIRREVSFTKGRIIVRGKLVTRGRAKRPDYILYFKPNIPLAVIEAKDNSFSVGGGMQQALDYATTLDIPFVFSSNGDGFVFHDRTGGSAEKETNLGLVASTLSRALPHADRRLISNSPCTCVVASMYCRKGIVSRRASDRLTNRHPALFLECRRIS